jgi:hypothetical protein
MENKISFFLEVSEKAGMNLGSASYTLPGVLHFLQMEWRKFEKERNEWCIEREELKVS